MDDNYDTYGYAEEETFTSEEPLFLQPETETSTQPDVNFDDPEIAGLGRVLLMGPRRGGKTSIQVSKKNERAPYRLQRAVYCLS